MIFHIRDITEDSGRPEQKAKDDLLLHSIPLLQNICRSAPEHSRSRDEHCLCPNSSIETGMEGPGLVQQRFVSESAIADSFSPRKNLIAKPDLQKAAVTFLPRAFIYIIIEL